ncbi:MAG: prenyltransferase/squalene oxidase repeat-containing protein [Planctomycetota bacterium]
MRLLALLLVLAAGAAAGPLTAGRAAGRKEKLLRRRGGNAATENAVANALAFLAARQTERGYWDADGFSPKDDASNGGGWHGERVPCPFDREVTALATLAFLGAGHTHRAGPYRDHVARALAWLSRPPGRATLFATAYATQALAEAYDLTGDASLKAAVDAGVEVMVASRQPQGGWRYWPGTRMASGVPTTTAVVCALRVAADAGFAVADDYEEPVLQLLGRLVDRKTGRVAYTLDGHKMGYTPTTSNAASALLVRARLGQTASHPEVVLGLRALAKHRPKWSIRFKTVKVQGVERRVQIGYLQHYYWWHGTEALARLGGGAWSAWNGALKKALLPKQRKTGALAGSWDPAGTYGKVGGRLFATALCTLMLESYYRYP